MHDMIRNHYQVRQLLHELVPLDGRGEVYTYTPTGAEDKPAYLYLVPLIDQWASRKSEVTGVGVDSKSAADLCAARGIDPDEAMRVYHQRRQQNRAETPVIIVEWPGEDGQVSHVVVDGNHRLVAWGLLAGDNPEVVPAYVVKQDFLLHRGFCRLLSRKLYQTLFPEESGQVETTGD